MNQQRVRATSGGLLSLHALTSVHWGTGASLGTVDLPIQRERWTGWPNGAGSALKGVLRDACREAVSVDHEGNRHKANESTSIRELFGSSKTGSEDTNAGAMSVTDARLLAMPVRSLKGVFAWVTCPAVLERLQRDALIAGLDCPVFAIEVEGQDIVVAQDCPLVVSGEYVQLDEETLSVKKNSNTSLIVDWIVNHLLPDNESYAATKSRFVKQMVIVSDDVFTHFVKYATEIVARIGLNYETKTVVDGALFYQELLPAESLLYSLVLINDSRAASNRKSKELLGILKELLNQTSMLQFGGDETTGKGLCSINFSSQGVGA